jgi:hypothetical protein
MQYGLDFGREIVFNIQSAMNAVNGSPAPINPLPYKDQFPNRR